MTRTSRCSAYLWLLSKVRSFHSWQDFSAFGSKARLEKRRGGNYCSYQDLCMQEWEKAFHWRRKRDIWKAELLQKMDWWVRSPQSFSVTKATCSGVFFGTLSSSLSSPMANYFQLSLLWVLTCVPSSSVSPLSYCARWSATCTLSHTHCSGSTSTSPSAWLSGLSGAMPHDCQPSVLPRINLPTSQAGNPLTLSPSNLTLIFTFAHLLTPSLQAQYLFCIFTSPYQPILNTELKCYLFWGLSLVAEAPKDLSCLLHHVFAMCLMLSPPCLVALHQDHDARQVTFASLYSVLRQYL